MRFVRLDGWWYAVEAGQFVGGPFRRKHELVAWYRQRRDHGTT
jgi:hypothetical protein